MVLWFRNLPKTHDAEMGVSLGSLAPPTVITPKQGSGFPFCLLVNCCSIKGHLKMNGNVEESGPHNVLLRLPAERRM